MKPVLMLLALVAVLGTVAIADEMKPMTSHTMVDPMSMQWGACPPNLPPGCKVAVLYGDPSKSGEEFVMRAWFPKGYRVMPHTHPMVENLTIISGTFRLGMGDKFDKTMGDKMPAGSFVSLPAEMHHYAWTDTDTVIQLNAMGPFTTMYLNPADDPSMKK